MPETLRAWLHTSDIRAYPLYSATIFLSAFLLFQVQPMIARFLLPFFGGAVSVWAASLVFFTGALFLGYLYVYAISRFSAKQQTLIHGAVIFVSLCAVLGTFLFADSVYPSFEWVFDVTYAPALQVIFALAVCIGIPYFLLSTTGPLLQHWYADTTGREPYHLYALSNAGSLIALATYPFITDKLFGLSTQQTMWSLLFLLFVGFLATAARSFRNSGAEIRAEGFVEGETIPYTRLLSWLVLAAIPAAMLVATTTRITQVIAPVPFLWVVPLGLYLLSFILAFRGRGQGGLVPFAVVATAIASYAYLDWAYATTGRQILANLALFFFSALFCHALLYRLRPAPRLSSFYYVWTSLGGAVGTLFVTLVAPVIFVDILEFPLGLAVLLGLAVAAYPAATYLRDEYVRQARVIKIAALIGVVVLFGNYLVERQNSSIYASRNFYGVVQIYDDLESRSLYHGTTMHGTQFLDAERAGIPTSYYAPTSGVGRAIIYAGVQRDSEPKNIGIIGLGSGTIAAYCDTGDKFVFYEIDRRIGDIATSYFTFLPSCAGGEIHFGDGRLSLTKERDAGMTGNYDVLAVDAFSDDTIPVHLLTKEAVELYLSHLRSDESILAIHTSNRFFELAPVVLRIAVELGLSASVISDGGGETEGASSSQWVLLARNPAVLEQEIFAEAASEYSILTQLWTDDHANVFAALDTSGGLSLWQSE